MAAPAELSLKNLDGTLWKMNRSLSGDYDSILAIQGISMLVRMISARTTLSVRIHQWDEDGPTRLRCVNTITGGLPGTTENFVLDWEPVEFKDAYFGNVRDRARWIHVQDLQEDYQKEGWEEGTTELVEIFTDHLDFDVTTSQVCGFEIVEGLRRYTRRTVVRKGDLLITVRLTFDYVGRVE